MQSSKASVLVELSRELECNVDDTFPVDGVSGSVGCRLEACRLNSANGGIAETVSEIAGDAEHLDGAGGRDPETNRDGPFDVQLQSFSGVLRLGLEEDLGGRAGGLNR